MIVAGIKADAGKAIKKYRGLADTFQLHHGQSDTVTRVWLPWRDVLICWRCF